MAKLITFTSLLKSVLKKEEVNEEKVTSFSQICHYRLIYEILFVISTHKKKDNFNSFHCFPGVNQVED